jgi:hypothetical protein
MFLFLVALPEPASDTLQLIDETAARFQIPAHVIFDRRRRGRLPIGEA